MDRWTERFNSDGEKAIAIHDGSDFLDTCFEGEREYDVMNALAEYEDLEEQGLLVRLPIALGSDVYFITVNNEIIHGICLDISLSDKQFYCQLGKWLKFSDIGQKVFRTRKEAEKKLEEMKK